MRAHALLTLLVLLSRAALDAAGLPFHFALDWMWLADPRDLRERLAETLLAYHAFPPGMNAVTGILLTLAGAGAPAAAETLFRLLGLVFANAVFSVGCAVGLSRGVAFGLALALALTPATIYLEHLYHYDFAVTTLLALLAALFHRAVRRPSFANWLVVFALGALVGLTRSTFHLVWFVALASLAGWWTPRPARRMVAAAAAAPALLLVAVYAKNLVLFGDFAISTFGPASYTLVTAASLPPEERDAWMAEGVLSPYAAISVYAPPRAYAPFFASSDSDRWPHQLTALEHRSIDAPNYNHWWLLEVHRARRADVLAYLRREPLGYLTNVTSGLREMFGPITRWHPRDGTAASPHEGHRRVLGPYEDAFNLVMHSWPEAPAGLYILLPVPLVWAVLRARNLAGTADPRVRAAAAVLVLCAFQIVYVTAASTMLTAREWPRYRFQIDWMIWLLFAACVLGRGRVVSGRAPCPRVAGEPEARAPVMPARP